MTPEQQVLAEIQRCVAELPAAERLDIENAAAELRYRAKRFPSWRMALCLVGAELAAEQ